MGNLVPRYCPLCGEELDDWKGSHASCGICPKCGDVYMEVWTYGEAAGHS